VTGTVTGLLLTTVRFDVPRLHSWTDATTLPDAVVVVEPPTSVPGTVVDLRMPASPRVSAVARRILSRPDMAETTVPPPTSLCTARCIRARILHW
jgi:hypothetical protein